MVLMLWRVMECDMRKINGLYWGYPSSNRLTSFKAHMMRACACACSGYVVMWLGYKVITKIIHIYQYLIRKFSSIKLHNIRTDLMLWAKRGIKYGC
jgi:hypothetical protein